MGSVPTVIPGIVHCWMIHCLIGPFLFAIIYWSIFIEGMLFPQKYLDCQSVINLLCGSNQQKRIFKEKLRIYQVHIQEKIGCSKFNTLLLIYQLGSRHKINRQINDLLCNLCSKNHMIYAIICRNHYLLFFFLCTVGDDFLKRIPAVKSFQCPLKLRGAKILSSF